MMNYNSEAYARYEDSHPKFWHKIKGQKVLEMLKPEANDRILEIGCDTGWLTRRLMDYSKDVVGIDVNDAGLKMADMRNLLCMDVANMGFADNSFDEEAVKKDQRNAMSHFYLGAAYGYKALHKSLKREWFSAFKDGQRNISCLKEAIKAEPTLYDAYYGLGVYHYWRSAKSKAFCFLPFIGDERQKGIDELWKSIHKGKHSAIEGRYALTTIYYNEADYQKAWDVNQQLYGLFPNNPACLYMRGRILEKLGKWKKAEMTFRRLLDHLMASEYRSIGYQIECHYRLAFYFSKQKQFYQALRECELTLQLSKLHNPSKELEGHLENTKEILEYARKLQRQLLKINVP